MDSIDLSADLTAIPTNQNARLLSESPLIARSSHTDLSSSDLNISVHDIPPGDHDEAQTPNDEQGEGEVEQDDKDDGEDEEAQIRRARKAARSREEKLQNDLFLLKKLNSAFALYTDALLATQSSTERLKTRLKDTNSLLDLYIGTLDRSEAVTKLILDEKWQGSSADEEVIMNQMREREAAKRREAEEREREAELARQRLEEERLAREEAERQQAVREKALEKKKGIGRGVSRTADSSSSGVRGVRGTRATMRARGVATGIARGTTTTSGGTGSGKTNIPRPPSSASTRTSMIPSRGRGRT